MTKNRKVFNLGNGFSELMEEFQYLKDFQMACLGAWDRRIDVQDNKIFCRLLNGTVIKAVNEIGVPLVFDLMVVIGKERSLFGEYHIAGIMDHYDPGGKMTVTFRYWFFHNDCIGNIYENEKGNMIVVFDGIVKIGEPFRVKSAEGEDVSAEEIGLMDLLRGFVVAKIER